MPTAQERFDNQDFPRRTSGIRDVLAGFTQDQLAAIDAFGQGGLGRLEDLLGRAAVAIQSIDAELVSQADIAGLMAVITAIQAEAAAFAADSDPSHLQRLLIALPDELADTLTGWLRSQPTEDAVASVARDFRHVLDRQLESLRTKMTETADGLDSLNAQLEETKNQMSSALGEESTKLQASISEQQARIDDLRATIDAQRPRIDEAIQRFESEFREGEKARGLQAKTKLDRFEADSSSLIGSTREQAEQFLADIAESLRQAQEIVGTIAVTGSAASYSDWAKTQNTVANRWSLGAVLAGLAAGITLLLDYQNNVGGTRSIVHLVAGLVLFGVAGYAGQQSALHRKREGVAKNIALKLIALPPFTEQLPDADKDLVKRNFAEKLFVGEDPEESTEPSITGSQISLISQIFDVVKKLKN